MFIVLTRIAISNFAKCVKPGGLLLIDHRNYDYIVNNCATPTNNIYYNVNYYLTSIPLLTWFKREMIDLPCRVNTLLTLKLQF